MIATLRRSANALPTLFAIAFWTACAVSLYFATTSATPSVMDGQWDKGQHMFAFATLALLAALAYPKMPLLRLTERLALYGAMIELIQSIPALHRSCDIVDWVADMIAIVAVLATVGAFRWWRSIKAS